MQVVESRNNPIISPDFRSRAASRLSRASAVAPHAAEEEGFIVLQPKFGPVICELVVAVETLPHHLGVARALARAANRQVHTICVLVDHTLRLNDQAGLCVLCRNRWLGLGLVVCRCQPPSTSQSIHHDDGGKMRHRAALMQGQRLLRQVVHDHPLKRTSGRCRNMCCHEEA
ncbi:hypothetical protein HYQ46_005393 [Verticillium longisporum]|nr:hypothetical protein HYQ46_005393 [Verticillium longisporum]